MSFWKRVEKIARSLERIYESASKNHPRNGLIYNYTDVLFKYLQWSAFVALIKYEGEKSGLPALVITSNVLTVILAGALSTSITNTVSSLIRPSVHNQPWTFSITLLISVALSTAIAVTAQHYLIEFIAAIVQFRGAGQ